MSFQHLGFQQNAFQVQLEGSGAAVDDGSGYVPPKPSRRTFHRTFPGQQGDLHVAAPDTDEGAWAPIVAVARAHKTTVLFGRQQDNSTVAPAETVTEQFQTHIRPRRQPRRATPQTIQADVHLGVPPAQDHDYGVYVRPPRRVGRRGWKPLPFDVHLGVPPAQDHDHVIYTRPRRRVPNRAYRPLQADLTTAVPPVPFDHDHGIYARPPRHLVKHKRGPLQNDLHTAGVVVDVSGDLDVGLPPKPRRRIVTGKRGPLDGDLHVAAAPDTSGDIVALPPIRPRRRLALARVIPVGDLSDTDFSAAPQPQPRRLARPSRRVPEFGDLHVQAAPDSPDFDHAPLVRPRLRHIGRLTFYGLERISAEAGASGTVTMQGGSGTILAARAAEAAATDRLAGTAAVDRGANTPATPRGAGAAATDRLPGTPATPRN